MGTYSIWRVWAVKALKPPSIGACGQWNFEANGSPQIQRDSGVAARNCRWIQGPWENQKLSWEVSARSLERLQRGNLRGQRVAWAFLGASRKVCQAFLEKNAIPDLRFQSLGQLAKQRSRTVLVIYLPAAHPKSLKKPASERARERERE